MTAWCIGQIWIHVRLVPLCIPSLHRTMPLPNFITFILVDPQFGLGFGDELRVDKKAFVKGSLVSQINWHLLKASMSQWIRESW